MTRRRTFGKILLGGLVLAMAAGLAGCGFRPLYGRHSQSAQADLAVINVRPIADRNGQQLRGFLETRFYAQGVATPRYDLAVNLREIISELGFRKDETATRANLTIQAKFIIADRQNNRIVYQGDSRFTNGYDILDNEFATIIAEQDARTKTLQVISDDITTQVAVFLNRARSPDAIPAGR